VHEPLDATRLYPLPTGVTHMTSIQSTNTPHVTSFSAMMAHFRTISTKTSSLYHAFCLHNFVQDLILTGRIESFRAYVDDSYLFPKIWNCEPTYDVFHYRANEVDIQEFIIVLMVCFKNVFDREGEWKMKGEHNLKKLFGNYKKMWKTFPLIHKECVDERWVSLHGMDLKQDWLIHFFYNQKFQGSENVEIVSLIRNQNRSDYMAYLHACNKMERKIGLGDAILVFRPTLHTAEGGDVFYRDVEDAMYAFLMYRSLKKGVEVSKRDPFQLNTDTKIGIEVLIFANDKKDFVEITIDSKKYGGIDVWRNNMYFDGVKGHGGVVRMLPNKKPIYFKIYEMWARMNIYGDLLKKVWVSNPDYFRMIIVTDEDFFVKVQEKLKKRRIMMQKMEIEREKMEIEKIANEAKDIFSVNDSGIEMSKGGTYVDIDIEMENLEEKNEIEWYKEESETVGGKYYTMEKVLEEMQEEEVCSVFLEGEEIDDIKVEWSEGKREEWEGGWKIKKMKTGRIEFKEGDTVKISNKVNDKYKKMQNCIGVIREVKENDTQTHSNTPRYYGVELVDRYLDDEIVKCNKESKAKERELGKKLYLFTEMHFVQCAPSAMHKLE
jgi:hypothetical protein